MTEANWVIAGRYRVLGRIGAGGMADVLRAHDELLDRDVAVKVFRSTPPAPDGTADTAKGVERQQAELAALAKLNHPNLTTLYDGSIVGQHGPAYLVMELIDGPSLAQVVADGGLSEAQARVVGAQIADALAYVHAAGMVHRDVKPANILLGHRPGEGMRARLTDFGIVRLVGNEPLTRADMTLGSASYLAPEQARGSAVGPAADIYALGLTLIETITGRRSFDGPALEAVVARLSSDPDIPTDLPDPWPSLLRTMTARDPAARPSASRVASALRGTASIPIVPAAPFVPGAGYETAILPAAAAAPELPFTRPPTASYPASARPERRWSASLIIAGILVLALVVTGIILLVLNSNDSSPTPTPTTSSSSRTTSASPSSSSSTSSSSSDGGSASTSTSSGADSSTPTSSGASSGASSAGSSSASAATSSASVPPSTTSTSSTPSTTSLSSTASSVVAGDAQQSGATDTPGATSRQRS